MTRQIIITPALNGFVCGVGCQQVVFETRERMLSELGSYLANPEETEKRFLKTAVNKMDGPAMPPPSEAYPPPRNTAEIPLNLAEAGQRVRG